MQVDCEGRDNVLEELGMKSLAWGRYLETGGCDSTTSMSGKAGKPSLWKAESGAKFREELIPPFPLQDPQTSKESARACKISIHSSLHRPREEK